MKYFGKFKLSNYNFPPNLTHLKFGTPSSKESQILLDFFPPNITHLYFNPIMHTTHEYIVTKWPEKLKVLVATSMLNLESSQLEELSNLTKLNIGKVIYCLCRLYVGGWFVGVYWFGLC